MALEMMKESDCVPELGRKQEPGTNCDGFIVEEWAAYAYTKTRIATAVCNENGRLNCRLTTLVVEHSDGDGHHKTTCRLKAAWDRVEEITSSRRTPRWRAPTP